MAKKTKPKKPSKKLLQKYKLVVDEWVINGFKDGFKAYQKYYKTASRATADVNFSKIKALPEIAEYIEKVKKDIAERNKVTIDECVSYFAKMMRFDIADLYNEDGTIKSIHDIPDDVRLAIAELSSFEEFQGKGEERNLIGFTKKLKTIDRKGVIIELMKYLGGYEKDNKQKVLPIREIIDMSNYKNKKRD